MQPWTNIQLFVGILILICVTGIAIWFVMKQVREAVDIKAGLVQLMVFSFTCIVVIYTLSKLAILRQKILSDTESATILEMMKFVLSATFGWVMAKNVGEQSDKK